MSLLLRVVPAIALSGVVFGAGQTSELHSIYVTAPSSDTRTAADYTLSVDGVAVPVIAVVSGPQAVSAIVLLDVSDSIGSKDAGNIAAQIAASVGPDDAIHLGTFANKILFSRTRLTDKRSASAAAAEVRQSGGVSPLWDALDEAAQGVGTKGLRGLIVFTDGMAIGNEHGSQEVVEGLAGSGIIVSFVGLEDSALGSQFKVAPSTRNDGMRAIVEMSGGAYSLLRRRSDSPSGELVAMLGDLRKRHRLDFKPPVRDGALHEIALTAKGMPVPVPRRLRF